MIKSLLLLILLVDSSLFYVEHNKSTYIIYNSRGEAITYQAMLDSLKQKEMVLFGELHDNPIAHWLQVELAKDLSKTRSLKIGAEMIETDNQEALDKYLSGQIGLDGLDSLARLWSNFKTDYAPLVNYAKTNQIPFIATNLPRPFANLVFKSGSFSSLDSLSDGEKAWIAPLPIAFDPDLPQYKKILSMGHGHGTPALVKAQAMKDATMAHFILENHSPDHLFIHINGRFHTDFYEGIVWYLRQSQPDLNLGTISTVNQENIHELSEEHLGRADFIICVDLDVPSTY